jgi:hypothetical protein
MTDTQPDDTHRGDEGDEMGPLEPFTREDEKELFSENATIVDYFRTMYRDNKESCPLYFQANVLKLSVDEVVRSGLDASFAQHAEIAADVYDIYKPR